MSIHEISTLSYIAMDVEMFQHRVNLVSWCVCVCQSVRVHEYVHVYECE